VSCDRVVVGSSKTTYLESATSIAYSLYDFYGATMPIKGISHRQTPLYARCSAENFQYRHKRAPKWRLFGNKRVNVQFLSSHPDRHIPASNRGVVFCVKISSGASAVGSWKNPKKQVNIFDAQFGAYGENPLRMTQFCMWIDIQDLITCRLAALA